MAAAPATATAISPLLPLNRSYASILQGDGSRPSSPRTERKLFSSIFSSKGVIPIRPVSKFKGEPAVFYSKDDIEVLSAPFKFSLVGKFGRNSRPLMASIRKFFVSLGLKSLTSVGLLHGSFILINVGSEEDYTRLLLRAVWYIEGRLMKLFKWTPDFTPFEDSPIVPVWIDLPGLPVHFFNKAALYSIASAFGKPLKSDEPTAALTRPSVARVCVELDVSKEWSSRIWIGEEKFGFWLFCSHCKVLGHSDSNCYKLHPSLLSEIKKKKEEGKRAEMVDTNKKTEKADFSQPAIPKTYRPITKSSTATTVHCKKTVSFAPSTSTENLPEAGIALTPFPDLEKLNKKQERLNKFPNTLVQIGKATNLPPLESLVGQPEALEGRIVSVIPEKVLQTDLMWDSEVPNVGDTVKGNNMISVGSAKKKEVCVGRPSAPENRVRPMPAHFPPLLSLHLSTAGIAQIPFPFLANTKGNRVKGRFPSEPFLVKNQNPSSPVPNLSPLKIPQTPSSQLDLLEVRKNTQTSSVSDGDNTASLSIMKEEQIKMQPCDQIPIKIHPLDPPTIYSISHLPASAPVNKEPAGSASSAQEHALTAATEKATAIPAGSTFSLQIFQRNGSCSAGSSDADRGADDPVVCLASLGRHPQQPMDQEIFEGLDCPVALTQSETDNRNKAADKRGLHATMAARKTEKAAQTCQKKIQPSDDPIDPQPSDSNAECGSSNLGFSNGLTSSRSTGLESSRGPKQIARDGLQSPGLKRSAGPNQAGSVEGKTTQLGSPAGSRGSSNVEMGLDFCYLNQMDSPPTIKLHPKKNSSSRKWKRGCTLRASISRRSLG